MNKKISLFLVAITGIVLMGCDKANTQNQAADAKKLSDKEVVEIVNKKVPNCEVVNISYDGDDNIPNYEVTVSDKDYKYDFEINASTGDIIKEGKNKVITNTKNPHHEIKVDADKAREIALSQLPNSTIIKYSLDEDDFIPNYEITVTDNTHTYEYKINAEDGSIIEKEIDITND